MATATLAWRVKGKVFLYLLGHSSCQVAASTIPRHDHALCVHGVLGEHLLLEKVFDHAVHVFVRNWKVVGGSKTISGERTKKVTRTLVNRDGLTHKCLAISAS